MHLKRASFQTQRFPKYTFQHFENVVKGTGSSLRVADYAAKLQQTLWHPMITSGQLISISVQQIPDVASLRNECFFLRILLSDAVPL